MNVWVEFAIAMACVFVALLLTTVWRSRERAASSHAPLADSEDVRAPATLR